MRRDDLLYGSHSGIQKAVRRGDLDLAKTCFDLMWPEKTHKGWLKWRLTSIVQEDTVGLVGELPSFYDRVKGLPPQEEETEWRKMVYRLTVTPANKDAGGLANLARLTEPVGDEHLELVLTRQWFSRMVDQGDDPGKVSDGLYDMLTSEFPVTEYQKAALKVLVKRTTMGGMLGDRQLSLPAMIIVVLRGLDPEVVQEGVKKGAAEWARQYGRKSPITVPLPWYSFDMHTQVGKIALSSISRRLKIDRDNLFHLWFLAESAFIPSWHCSFKRPQTDLSIWDSVWWPLAVAARIGVSRTGSTAKHNLKWWRDELRGEVKGMIEWLLNQREKED